jgi:hypothetical protein
MPSAAYHSCLWQLLASLAFPAFGNLLLCLWQILARLAFHAFGSLPFQPLAVTRFARISCLRQILARLNLKPKFMQCPLLITIYPID